MSARADFSDPVFDFSLMKSARLLPGFSLPVVGPRFWLIGLACMFVVDVLMMFPYATV
jgi:hypothetical protein